MKQTIFPKKQIKGFRNKLSWLFYKIAYWIYPDSEIGKCYLLDIVLESELEKMKYGKSCIQIKVKKKFNHSK